jgi:hypothetical protein
MLEAIIEAGDASSYLRMTQFVPTLQKLAQRRLERAREKTQYDSGHRNQMESRVGTRKIRSFRIVRFRDAEPRDYNRPEEQVSAKRLKCERTTLLKVWDYDEMGREEGRPFHLQVGDHYRVSIMRKVTREVWEKWTIARAKRH